MVKFHNKSLCQIGKCIIGDDCIIHAFVFIGDGVIIGSDCKIQAYAFIPPEVTIGNNVFIGPHVCFTNDKYPPSGKRWKTFVEDNVVIGAGAIILPGVTLHKGCKISAGSIVKRDVEPGTTVINNRQISSKW